MSLHRLQATHPTYTNTSADAVVGGGGGGGGGGQL